MLHPAKPPARAGLTLIELIIAIGLIATLVSMSLVFVAGNQQSVTLNQDRALAVQKATSMLAELRGVAENPATVDASTLDAYDNGAGTSFVLCADAGVLDPRHEASGNEWTGDRWRFSRRITVRKFANLESRDVRIVTVRVFRTDPSGVTDAVTLADVASVINTTSDGYPPSQVYDVYLLAVENVPGWWVYMSYIRPFIETAFDDLEARQPGLVFRRHWVTCMGYGRDPVYKPYFNRAVDSVQDINWAYFYPGTMPAGSAVDQYYVPDTLTARAMVDAATVNDYNAATNPLPYALADQFNHNMRAPNERALFDARVAAGLEDVNNPTYRLLLDDMIANPDKYRNAIFINLHGELVPFPALRNYSDAAKEPAGRPWARVVTHPEKLRSPHAENVRLRVYAYYENAALNAGAANFLNTPISIFVPNANLTTPGDLTITSIRGGTDQEPLNAANDTYLVRTPAFTNLSVFDPASPNRMFSSTAFVVINGTPGTLVSLSNTPLKCTPVAVAGLDPTQRLYGNEYIPCTTEVANDFSKNLVNATATPKNTARWILDISPVALNREFGAGADTLISIQTRIGNDQTTGTMWPVQNQPHNLSQTYVWRSNTQNFVPFSEQFQYQGDPRHMPYRDVKVYHGYNWYFDNLRDAAANVTANWPGLDAGRIRNTGGNDFDGWHGSGTNGVGADSIEVDVPRCFQLLRTALTESNSIYTTLTGFSYYYMGNGNEIGYDGANGFANSIPVSRKPFDGLTGSRFEDSITTINTGGVKLIREFNVGYWWSKPWLGELFPDRSSALVNLYASWVANGNLLSPTGGAAQPGRFVRIRRQDVRTAGVAPLAAAGSLPTGTTFSDHLTLRRLNARGCVSFFNLGTTLATFRHNYRDNTTGNADVGGVELDNTYNFPVPTNTRISRPFRLDYNLGAAGVGDEFSMPEYIAPARNVGTRQLHYYNHQDGTLPWLGSAIVRLTNNNARSGFIAVNGIDRTVETGSAFIATFSSLTLVHTFLSSGLSGTPSRVIQLPQIVIDSPNDATELENPVTVSLMWTTRWARWDGKAYTPAYPNYGLDFLPGNLAEPQPVFADPRYTAAEIPEDDQSPMLRYALLYSVDNGVNWLHILDNSPAVLGQPNTALLIADLTRGGGEQFDWDVTTPVFFAEASYLIRVEAYRDNLFTAQANDFMPHYAYHQQKIFIDR